MTKPKTPLSNWDQLQNLYAAMVRCDECDNAIERDWNFCAWCGWQLKEDEELAANGEATNKSQES